jgi:hypothetical protein
MKGSLYGNILTGKNATMVAWFLRQRSIVPLSTVFQYPLLIRLVADIEVIKTAVVTLSFFFFTYKIAKKKKKLVTLLKF